MISARGVATFVVVSTFVSTGHAVGQVPDRAPPPPPATKLGAFEPAAGTLLRLAYTDLGEVKDVAVDVREISDTDGNVARGLLVDVTQSEYRRERAFVDSDEIPELLSGIDALLDVASNPTEFVNFEFRYTTRGELEITAFNNSRGQIRYAVQAGRITTAQQFLDRDDLERLRLMFFTALDTILAMERSSP